jgi:hypothetical protein
MRYQTIEQNNRIVNRTPFGRRLRRFLRKPEQKALLPEGGCWRSAGAWILADALVHWSGRRLTMSCLRAPDGSVDHVVAAEPRAQAFIDADGVAGQVELMTKMAVIMHAPSVALAEFAPDKAVEAGLPYREDIAVEMAMRILRRFGNYRPELLNPAEQHGLALAGLASA